MTFSSNLYTKRQSARNEMLALSFAIKVWDIYSIFHYFNMTPILHLINWRRFNPLRSVSSLVLAMAYRLIDGKSSPAPVLDYCSLDYWEGTKLGDFFYQMQQYYIKNRFENTSRGMLVLSRPQCVNDHGSFSRFHKLLTLDLHTADNTPNIPVNQVSWSRSKKNFFRNGQKTEFWPFMFHTFILKLILQRKKHFQKPNKACLMARI